MTKKLTNKNVKREITKAIKKVATAGLKEIKNQRIRGTGVWGLPIRVSKVENNYTASHDVSVWCFNRDFPYPKNEEEENRILGLFDFRLFILKRELKNFVNDILDILVAERAILFYLGVAMGVILGFSAYHYFF